MTNPYGNPQPYRQQPYRQQPYAPAAGAPQQQTQQSPYQAPRHPQYVAPMPQPQATYTRRRPARTMSSRTLAALIIGIFAFAFVFGGTYAIVMARQSHARTASASQGAIDSLRARGYEPDDYVDDDGRVKDEQVYYYAQSEGFSRYADALVAMRDKHLHMDVDRILEIPPEKSRRGADYYHVWITWLTDQHAAQYFGDDRVTSDPNEIEKYYDAQIAALDDMEQQFLKGEDLGFTVRAKQEDGTWNILQTDDQDAVSQQEQQPDRPATQDTVATLTAKWEQAITSVPDTPSADGTYTQVGEQLAASVGPTMNYDFQSIYGHCTMDGRLGDPNTFGAYCPLTPQVIYLNTDSNQDANDVRSPYYAADIRHEPAHARCTPASTRSPERRPST
ncbi:hypothetical protein [Bifidobacterium cuniculi]|uniref:Uncharacterized protein n=1 Tax=Bifidobacterium cuniculi TaxID=1688 RepID=A0A087AKK6_9BIFI|nr:hypothetical protein [Bifidobacterium cuniculi]KFI59306.1 hypothetical protein BCUN_1647 [Bifidobacterium cuniculi]